MPKTKLIENLSKKDKASGRQHLIIYVNATDEADKRTKEAELAGDMDRILSTDTYLEIEEVGLDVDDKSGSFMRIEAEDKADAQIKFDDRKDYFSGQSIRARFHTCAHKDNHSKAEKDKIKCTFEKL